MTGVHLSDISDLIDYGVTASANDRGAGPKFLRITDIQDGTVNWDSVPYCDANARKLIASRLNPGDIVFARTGATTGKSFLIKYCPDNAVFASYLIRVRPNKFVDCRYLAHFFDSQDYWNQISQKSAGAAQPGVNSSKLKELVIPLLPLADQKRIATILDQADEVRRKRELSFRTLGVLGDAIFYEMFGDPVTNHRCWSVKRIGDIAEVVTGNTPPRANAANYGNNIEWIKSDNINTPNYYLTEAEERLSKEGESIARRAPPGSILVTCIAGSPDCIGNAAMADRMVSFNQQINAIVHTSGDPHYLYAVIRLGKRLVREASAGGMKGLVSKSRFEAIKLPFPPIELQQAFGERILAVERAKSAHQGSLDRLNALFSSLQHRAFSGELSAKVAERELAEAS